jgi:hypothetical protein
VEFVTLLKIGGCEMGNNLIAILIGLITSIAGGYLYTYLIKINFPFVYAVGGICIISALTLILYIYRGKIFLITRSGIIGYYPGGQPQFIRRAVSEVKKSREITIVGARGMNLTGESSPIGNAIKESKTISKIMIYLLDIGSEHSRLRSDHLAIERKKYEAECISVDSFIGVLKLHTGLPITKYSYKARPLLRLIITDFSIFLSFYQTGIRGNELPCWHISKKSKVLCQQVQSYYQYLAENATVQEYKTL